VNQCGSFNLANKFGAFDIYSLMERTLEASHMLKSAAPTLRTRAATNSERLNAQYLSG
jgi:hypothetical protein